jgi:Type I phosphodiesterase / nucleotide pyrophosphatase
MVMKRLPRVFWLLVDGLPLWVAGRYSQRPRELPALAWLHRENRIAALAPAFPNCQTPPSLFTLFSGVPPASHGVHGFDVPVLGGPDPLATRPAFDDYPSDIPMIWDLYAERQQSIRLCHLPFVQTGRLGPALRSASFGFVRAAVAAAALPLPSYPKTLELPETDLMLFRDCAGTNGCRISVLSPRDSPQSAPLDLPAGKWMTLSLTEDLETLIGRFRVDGEERLLLSGAWRIRYHGDVQHTDFVGLPFAGGGFSKLYREQHFGRTLHDGGDGSAEEILCSGLRFIGERCWAEARWAQARGDSCLIVAYQPILDLLFHELLGFLSEDLRFSNPRTAARADALLLQALKDLDRNLLAIIGASAEGDRVLVSSDHGMKPIDTIIYPNAALRENGWLVATDSGRIDAARSVAFFHPAENGLVCFNKQLLTKRGLPPELILDELVAKLRRATGHASSWFVFEQGEKPYPSLLARHYLASGKGQMAKAAITPYITKGSRKTGDHCVAGEDQSLQGVVIDLSNPRLHRSGNRFEAHEVLDYILSGESGTSRPESGQLDLWATQ